MAADSPLERLLKRNEQWAKDNADLFPQLSQSPRILWFGCADSRVPESVITASLPGDIFVHRNIANQILEHDDSALSAIAFGVEAIGVDHIVVVGHTRCGAAAAALDPLSIINLPTLVRWLTPLIKLAASLNLRPSTPPSYDDVLKVVEANVRQQVKNVIAALNARNAEETTAETEQKTGVTVHGWVYQVEDGKLRDLNVNEVCQCVKKPFSGTTDI